jgi:hypothetical protein
VQLPAESWIAQGTATLQINSQQPVSSVSIDPEHVLPDEDRSNNRWQPPH